MRRRLAYAVALLLATLCGTLPAMAAETVILGSVGSGTANAWPSYIGIDKGFFAAEGLTADLVHAQSNAGVIQQVAAGSINVEVLQDDTDVMIVETIMIDDANIRKWEGEHAGH